MKGVVFCEFIEMVDTKISPDVAETIIDKADLPSGGVYTSVGTYSHHEIISLVVALSEETNIPIPQLVATFGNYLFGRFVETHSQFFEDTKGCFHFLEHVDDYIHVEVLKLYPDAELPKITTEYVEENVLKFVYRSGRSMGDLAQGLLEACIQHFEENISIERTDLESSEDEQVVEFILTKQ